LLEKQGIDVGQYVNIRFIPPQSYFENLGYLMHAERVITDSGGLQKEAWFVRKPCVTLRPETEWVETLENQWNILVFDQLKDLPQALETVPGSYDEGVYGDGHAAEKMRDSIISHIEKRGA